MVAYQLAYITHARVRSQKLVNYSLAERPRVKHAGIKFDVYKRRQDTIAVGAVNKHNGDKFKLT